MSGLRSMWGMWGSHTSSTNGWRSRRRTSSVSSRDTCRGHQKRRSGTTSPGSGLSSITPIACNSLLGETPMRPHTLLFSAMIVLSLVTNTLGADEHSPPDQDNGRDKVQESIDYRIGPEDVLDIAVWHNEAMSRTVPVRPDGKISLPLVNEVQAAGLTPMQLRDALSKKLEEYMPNPEVSVIVKEVHSFKVSVVGEVKRPGRHELKSRATVLDVLAMAEGLGEFASRGRIVILRPDGNTLKRIPFNYNKVVSANGANGELENFLLQPGDIVVVP